MTSFKTADYDAVIIGAGFGGIRALWEVRQLGLKVRCFEAGSDVGGAWYWNRYPGARTDSEAWVYAMNFTPGLSDQWNYHERYPSQEEVQKYLSNVVGQSCPFTMWIIIDHFDMRKNIEFETRVDSAHYDDTEGLWTVTTANRLSVTCRYFIPATGPLSVAKDPPFPGLKSFKGEWYQSSNWPTKQVDFANKRIAVVGTGATGVQIIPKLATVAKTLTVFQRTPNYVLPGRNYVIDEYQAAKIKQTYDATWKHAKTHPFGLAMTSRGNKIEDEVDREEVRHVLDSGWETGGFHFQFETFDDIFTNQMSNDLASDYIRQKIQAIVQDPNTAEILSPKYPFLSKRPPCGHFYYETYNQANVKLVDISQDSIELYEEGIRTGSGIEYEFDMIIFALGFDAATGALSEMDVRGSQNKSLRETWKKKLETFAGILVPGFPNMFMICGPHVPFGNMPVVVDIEVGWIGKTICHMEEKEFSTIHVSEKAVSAWSSHLVAEFQATLLKNSAKETGAWFVGANIPGKAREVLFYFGGVPNWNQWLNSEIESSWESMELYPHASSNTTGKDRSD
ncbi:putative Cyclohexanone monooxygenase [Seiridium unicorne]|uniref:Cyclohexanone monooxygenase n=1 Tax=Seiridium unicorne TaxID=138068 RepID=A0ABR2V7T9_9PEZI